MKARDALAVSVAGVLGSLILVTCVGRVVLERPGEPTAATGKDAPPSPSPASNAARICTETIAQKKALYVQLLDQRHFWDARLALADCPEILKDPTLVALKAGASRLSYLVTINNVKEPSSTRLEAITSLRSEVPDEARQFDQLEARLRKEVAAVESRLRDEQSRLAAKVRAMKWYDACRAWGREARAAKATPLREALIEHLKSSDTVNSTDLYAVTDRVPRVGMTVCGVYAMLGLPDSENRTTLPTLMQTQMVYNGRSLYVYTRAKPDDNNGIVYAVQH